MGTGRTVPPLAWSVNGTSAASCRCVWSPSVRSRANVPVKSPAVELFAGAMAAVATVASQRHASGHDMRCSREGSIVNDRCGGNVGSEARRAYR